MSNGISAAVSHSGARICGGQGALLNPTVTVSCSAPTSIAPASQCREEVGTGYEGFGK